MAAQLTDDDLDRIRTAMTDCQYGNNTQDLARRYARDVRKLLDDRDRLMDKVARLENDVEKRHITND
jgi:hypothetical protein